MIKERDEELLWDTVTLLREQNHLENAKAVLKSLVERTFSLLRKPTDFLEESSVEIPSLELFHTFRQLDHQIHVSLRKGDIEEAHNRLIDYIELLAQMMPEANKEQIRKKILARLLTRQYLDTHHQESGKMEVYTSTEAAEILGVTDQTIRRWCANGKYPDAFQTDGGHWRIPKEYFKMTLGQARQRRIFEEQLNQVNQSQGEADEDEWL